MTSFDLHMKLIMAIVFVFLMDLLIVGIFAGIFLVIVYLIWIF